LIDKGLGQLSYYNDKTTEWMNEETGLDAQQRQLTSASPEHPDWYFHREDICPS
jgi:hypothetical protein